MIKMQRDNLIVQFLFVVDPWMHTHSKVRPGTLAGKVSVNIIYLCKVGQTDSEMRVIAGCLPLS